MFSNITIVPCYDYSKMPSNQHTDTELYFKEWLTYIRDKGYLDDELPIIAKIQPGYRGVTIGYSSKDITYACFLTLIYGENSIRLFGYSNGNWFYTAK
jgi:hypothetical protein